MADPYSELYPFIPAPRPAELDSLKDVVDFTSQAGKGMDTSGFRRSKNVEDYRNKDFGFLGLKSQADIEEIMKALGYYPQLDALSTTIDPMAVAAGYNSMGTFTPDVPMPRPRPR